MALPRPQNCIRRCRSQQATQERVRDRAAWQEGRSRDFTDAYRRANIADATQHTLKHTLLFVACASWNSMWAHRQARGYICQDHL